MCVISVRVTFHWKFRKWNHIAVLNTRHKSIGIKFKKRKFMIVVWKLLLKPSIRLNNNDMILLIPPWMCFLIRDKVQPPYKVVINWIMTLIYLNFFLLQTIFMVISSTWRSAKNWSNDGVFCSALLSTKSRYIHQHRHMLCAQFCHNYVKYITA